MQTKQVEVSIANKTGLHARPASLFVQHANRYQAQIEVTCRDKTVNAKSILGILCLGVAKGSRVLINARGEDAAEAVEGLKKLVEQELPRMDGED